MAGTIVSYLKEDEEYMYFKVYTLNNDGFNPGYESIGTVRMEKVNDR